MENENSEPESLLFNSNFNSLEDGSFLWSDAVHWGHDFKLLLEQFAPSQMRLLAPLQMAQDCPQ